VNLVFSRFAKCINAKYENVATSVRVVFAKHVQASHAPVAIYQLVATLLDKTTSFVSRACKAWKLFVVEAIFFFQIKHSCRKKKLAFFS
jgi:hypothetical protein